MNLPCILCGEGHLELTVPSGPLPSGETSVFYFVVIITCIIYAHNIPSTKSEDAVNMLVRSCL